MTEERLQLIPQKYKGMKRNYCEELYVKKFENLGEMDKFLEIYNHLRMNEKKQKT